MNIVQSSNRCVKYYHVSAFLLLLCILSYGNSFAQYWGVLPGSNSFPSAYYSSDDKRLIYLSSQSGMANIYSYDLKTATSVAVTNLSDAGIASIYQVPNKQLVIYMKASAEKPNDFHLYKITNDGKGTPEDLTPTKEGVSNKMLGASYNGRYVYYSSNKANLSKTDFYRYDIAQNISELVFANDKNYELLSWTKDQNLVLLKEPVTSKMFLSNVQTTEREPFETPASGTNVVSAMWAPNGKQFYLLANVGTVTHSYNENMASATAIATDRVANVGSESHFYIANMTSATSIASDRVNIDDGVINSVNPSIGGKFIFIRKDGVLHITDAPGNPDILSSADLLEAITNGKETMILLTTKTAEGRKLQIYDVTKKTTTDIVTIKN